MRAARARVNGGIGGWPCACEEWGAVAALLGRVDDFAAVRGIVASVLRCCVAWRSSVAAWP